MNVIFIQNNLISLSEENSPQNRNMKMTFIKSDTNSNEFNKLN